MRRFMGYATLLAALFVIAWLMCDRADGELRTELGRLFPGTVKVWTDAHRGRFAKARQTATRCFEARAAAGLAQESGLRRFKACRQ
jgi:hypothetical protein